MECIWNMSMIGEALVKSNCKYYRKFTAVTCHKPISLPFPLVTWSSFTTSYSTPPPQRQRVVSSTIVRWCFPHHFQLSKCSAPVCLVATQGLTHVRNAHITQQKMPDFRICHLKQIQQNVGPSLNPKNGTFANPWVAMDVSCFQRASNGDSYDMCTKKMMFGSNFPYHPENRGM